MLGAAGHPGHALARLGKFYVPAGIVFREQFQREFVIFAGNSESRGDRIGSYIVMRGTDSAGGEYVGVPCPHPVQGFHDGLLIVGHDTYFLQVDPYGGHYIGEMTDVTILRASRKNLIADYQHAGGYYGVHVQPPMKLLNSGSTVWEQCHPFPGWK